MLKRTISIFLIFCFVLHCSARMGIVAYFYTHQSYIAEVLCINKAKPEANCKGKCFLSQKLKSLDDQSQQLPSSIKSVRDSMFFANGQKLTVSPVCSSLSEKCYNPYQIKDYRSSPSRIELPPKLNYSLS